MMTKAKTFIGYIVRSTVGDGHPNMPAGYKCRHYLCTNGEFIHEDFIGPGTRYAAKIYKTKAGASRVRDGRNIEVEEYYE